MPPRYPTNPNRIILDLDPITSDALTAATKAAKTTRQRLAYELVQAGLKIHMRHPADMADTPQEPDDAHRRVMQGLADVRAYSRGKPASGDPDAK